jgi:hypothetical protein
MSAFSDAKQRFDSHEGNASTLPRAYVPVDGKVVENIAIRNPKGIPLEEYYKWNNSGDAIKNY